MWDVVDKRFQIIWIKKDQWNRNIVYLLDDMIIKHNQTHISMTHIISSLDHSFR